MSNLEELSTEQLRLELQRRVELAKTQKTGRIKELQDLIQKSQSELRSLMGEVNTPKNKGQKALDAMPSVVRNMMPKDLKQSLEDGTDPGELPRPTRKSGAPKEIQRCSNCQATASNWEYSPHDDTMYCVCGEVISENASANGLNR